MDATHDRTPQGDAAGDPEGTTEQLDVTVRRSPKYGAFAAAGALVGAVAAGLIAASMPQAVNENGVPVDTTPVIGLMVVAGFVVGGGLGALVAIIVDRALAKRTTATVAERVEVRRPDALPTAEDDALEARFERLGGADPGLADPAVPGAAERERGEDDRPGRA
ncbi:hypothetical protein L332_08610 [Agrococcus pavilionensis RW1]|uniref:Uncharacterized protein n=1 Tax=Agrococcus pavilionensis RW1 TaxID=1330458 RepID=U1MV23_9MICO|nr:hypothetical protein [Agrococcus pavilionensis]ERG64510.1 hypothetical protein L332_08610 [Agrococcus pavilionensis RW1]